VSGGSAVEIPAKAAIREIVVNSILISSNSKVPK